MPILKALVSGQQGLPFTTGFRKAPEQGRGRGMAGQRTVRQFVRKGFGVPCEQCLSRDQKRPRQSVYRLVLETACGWQRAEDLTSGAGVRRRRLG